MTGKGTPMQTFWSGNFYDFHDGAGLCSPGRWPPEQRRKTAWREAKMARKELLDVISKSIGDTGDTACTS